ncbi:MAG: mandelate racemase [Actinomycetota bacterium]|nr:mandelate racemase [Actinomycetota bacterium]
MKIIAVNETTVPIRSSLRNAFISFDSMDVSVVAVVSDVVRDGRKVTGFGFNSNGRYSQSGLLNERFIPRMLSAEPDDYLADDGPWPDPVRMNSVLMAGEKPGGHGDRSVAVGILDMAVWDLASKLAGVPLYEFVATRHGNGKALDRVPVYAAGGYYEPDKGLAELGDEMRGYLDLGYTNLKMKIGGTCLAGDLARIETVLELIDDPGRLAVDANARFDLEEAAEYADALAPFGLRWFEEPGDPLDYELHRVIASVYPPPLATGENLFSSPDARNLALYAGLRPDQDILQFDPALSYGLPEFLKTVEALAELGWDRSRYVPHGGHQFALGIAAGLGLGGNESYPGIFEPFGGFADGFPVEDGFVALPDTPGIGLEHKSNLLPTLRQLSPD